MAMLALCALGVATIYSATFDPTHGASHRYVIQMYAIALGLIAMLVTMTFDYQLRPGPATGGKPQLNDEVKVQYEVKLINGKVFDSSYERGQPASMPLNRLVPELRPEFAVLLRDSEFVCRDAGFKEPPQPADALLHFQRMAMRVRASRC